jgi:hypothetical protein
MKTKFKSSKAKHNKPPKPSKKQNRPPFDDIWTVVNYLADAELHHYRDWILNGNGDKPHIYCHIHQILHWLSQCPDADPGAARLWLADNDKEIAAARADARECKKKAAQLSLDLTA